MYRSSYAYSDTPAYQSSNPGTHNAAESVPRNAQSMDAKPENGKSKRQKKQRNKKDFLGGLIDKAMNKCRLFTRGDRGSRSYSEVSQEEPGSPGSVRVVEAKKRYPRYQNIPGRGMMDGGGGDVSHPQLPQWAEYTFHREGWKVKTRFHSLKAVNAGAFGTVCSAVDSSTGQEVAIKRMNQPFKSEIHAKRALRELKLLRFVQHDNLVSLVDAFTTAPSPNVMVDLYLVMPLLDTDLHQLIQQFKQSAEGRLSDDYIHFFMYQMLRGLKYLHSANIMHRDLKPSNIAIKTDCSLKIIDFGLGRKSSDEVTGYVQTRWYRAPEVMIDWKHYGSAVDLWSLGCILGEMLLSRPVFKEDDHVELLRRQILICGTPDQHTLDSFESKQAVTFIQERLNNQPRENFQQYFMGSPPCIDLLERLLQMNPNDRLTAEVALSHPYFSQLHDPKDEKSAALLFDDSFENIRTTAELKSSIFNEVQDVAGNGPCSNPLFADHSNGAAVMETS